MRQSRLPFGHIIGASGHPLRRLLTFPVAAAVTAASLAAFPVPARAAPSPATGVAGVTSHHPPMRLAGRTAPLPKASRQPVHLARMGLGGKSGHGSQQAAIAAAARQAERSGKPAPVAALTTPTTTVAVGTHGQVSLITHVFPVRVRRGHGWVPVSTALVRGRDGSLRPGAVPADTVTFSGGGLGPLAAISAAGTSLSLSWPGRLPVPVVSGDAATYRNVLPGVDLMLTATSVQAGGFSEVLVVHSAAAARNPALGHLSLGVVARGVRLASAGGSLVASAAGAAGEYVAPAPRMWDSSSAAGRAAAAAARAARAVGAYLAPAGPPSSVAGPGGGARLAGVAASVSPDGRRLSLVPDAAMLSSASTKWPVYIDPSFQWQTKDGGQQAFAPVQSENDGSYDCASYKNYNNTSGYPVTPVGYDNFGAGPCEFGDTDYSYFQVAVPSQVWHANLDSATVKASEAYSSDCVSKQNVTLSWTGGIGSGTDWNNRPGVAANQDTVSVGPDPGSCNSGFDYSKTVGVSFNVMNAMGKAASASSPWRSFTFRLWEQGSPSDVVHKQFADHGSAAPYLQIIYNDTPSTPASEKATANSDGSASAGCDTTATNSPAIGKISGNGPYLWAYYHDPDGDSVQGTIRYWTYPAASPAYHYLSTAADLASAGQTAAEPIPASFYSAMANGQVIAWDTNAWDGHTTNPNTYLSPWSPTCYFTAWPTAPAAPTLSAPTPGSNCPNGVITAGCQVTFTITAASNDPATEFVWRLDQYPATTSPPASEKLAASGSPPTATLTMTVPSPGPHNLWVYASDAGANDSGDTNGNPAGSGTSTFIAAGDPAVSCASFADALASTCSGPSSPETMMSKTSGSPLSCGAGTGDGGGTDLDATGLASAGWHSGGTVTVDGATFTLPGFGNCQADNVLAANQTIGMGGGQGSALVFLATSTYAFAAGAGLTGTDDSGVLAPDVTVPGVPGGVGVTGGGCTYATQNDANQAGCNPATGTVNYATGAGCAETASTYYLTVPDWTYGPADIAAVSVPYRDTLTGGQLANNPKIYAFAVPIAPGCQVASVTLPDVGGNVIAQLNGGSSPATYNTPALHIFGMAIRNTTTATPGVPSAASPSGITPAPSGQSWTGTWANPAEVAMGPSSGAWGNQTVRIQAQASAGGNSVRIRLSDPGFLSRDGDAPIQIGHATVAAEYYSYYPAATPVNLTFGGSPSVTIPEGGDIYSDPLNFPVTAGENLLISLYLANVPGSLPYLPTHSWASSGVEWVTAPAPTGTSGDYTTDTTGGPFTASGAWWTINTGLLTGVDVTTAQTATDPGGTPTVSVLGDNLIDVNYNVLGSGAVSIPITRIDGSLAAAGAGSIGVVTGGMNSNEASADSGLATGAGGVSAVARLDRDILAEPGIGTVVIDEGLQDLLHGASEQSLEDAYKALMTELNGFGVNVVIATITPCTGYSSSAANDSCSSAVDAARTDVNDNFIANVGVFPNCWSDFGAAVGNGATPEALVAANDAGDHVNLSQAGYTALAGAVTAQGCTLGANQNPPP